MPNAPKIARDEKCPACRVTYEAFRCATIRNYSDAYHQITWGMDWNPSRRAVLSHWSRCKREEWAYHVAHCGTVVECEPVDSADFADDFDDDFADDTSFDFGCNAPAETDTDTDTEKGETEMTTTTTKTTRAIDFRCPKCDARPGNACKGSRQPSANSLGGGWGGPPDRTRPHDERYAVRRAAIALDVTPADIVSTHRATFVAAAKIVGAELDAAARTTAFDFVNDSYALVVQDAPADAPADDAPVVDTRTLSLFDDGEMSEPVVVAPCLPACRHGAHVCPANVVVAPDALAALAVGDIVESVGTAGTEEHDTGRVVEVHDTGEVDVAWRVAGETYIEAPVDVTLAPTPAPADAPTIADLAPLCLETIRACNCTPYVPGDYTRAARAETRAVVAHVQANYPRGDRGEGVYHEVVRAARAHGSLVVLRAAVESCDPHAVVDALRTARTNGTHERQIDALLASIVADRAANATVVVVEWHVLDACTGEYIAGSVDEGLAVALHASTLATGRHAFIARTDDMKRHPRAAQYAAR